MEQLTSIDAVRSYRKGVAGRLGFVPTMGALHEGHAALIRRSVAENDATVVSVFVNPTQFGPGEDLHKYPRTLEADLDLCEREGAAAVFTPNSVMMYPAGFTTWVNVEGLTDKLCGRSRPNHFRGVCTVVAKLFNIVAPTRAYFGQKDAQQAIVLTRMARDLDLPLEVITCPTVREPDGLAMSSRNRYLDDRDRQRALSLYRALQAAETGLAAGETDVATLKRACWAELDGNVERVDYVEVLDATDLGALDAVNRPALCAIAAFVGSTRLIDNVILTP
ncbi:MAG: pantoate--beta-alanine ligase [Planctomycetes bacterium]|nr:pantoate--beta-alanine ligase [Planctomycetota bacterium]